MSHRAVFEASIAYLGLPKVCPAVLPLVSASETGSLASGQGCMWWLLGCAQTQDWALELMIER